MLINSRGGTRWFSNRLFQGNFSEIFKFKFDLKITLAYQSKCTE